MKALIFYIGTTVGAVIGFVVAALFKAGGDPHG